MYASSYLLLSEASIHDFSVLNNFILVKKMHNIMKVSISSVLWYAWVVINLSAWTWTLFSRNLKNQRDWTLPPHAMGIWWLVSSKCMSSVVFIFNYFLFPSHVGWGFEQPGLVEDVPAWGRGVGTRWSLRLFPMQTILWFILWFYVKDKIYENTIFTLCD